MCALPIGSSGKERAGRGAAGARVCSSGSADHVKNARARAAARRARSYPEEPGCPFWHSRHRVRGALLPVRILRGLAESRTAPVLLRNNGVKEPLPDNALYRDGNAVDAGVSVRKGTPVGAIRVSRGQDVEQQED